MSKPKDLKPISRPDELLLWLDDLWREETGERLDKMLAENPQCDKAEVLRDLFKLAEVKVKECVTSILKANPDLPSPPNADNPFGYLQNVRIWCAEHSKKANPAKLKPAETEQNTVLMKCWGFIKKIVEKGWQIFTKSFWEAVFDRMGLKRNG